MCDPTPSDPLLWGLVESKLYKNNNETFPELKEEIPSEQQHPARREWVGVNFKNCIIRLDAINRMLYLFHT